jgi:hypothetical protein
MIFLHVTQSGTLAPRFQHSINKLPDSGQWWANRCRRCVKHAIAFHFMLLEMEIVVQ